MDAFTVASERKFYVTAYINLRVKRGHEMAVALSLRTLIVKAWVRSQSDLWQT